MNVRQLRAWQALELGPTLLVRRPGPAPVPATALGQAAAADQGVMSPAEENVEPPAPRPASAGRVETVRPSHSEAAPAPQRAQRTAPAQAPAPEAAPALSEAPRRAAAPARLLAAAAALQNKAAETEMAAVATMDWAALNRTMAACQRCGLCRSRRQVVIGSGAAPARWVVIGAAPGAREDELDVPVAGNAGRLLDAMLAAVGGSREREVFILNAVKCSPPDQRDPSAQELAACRPLLTRQLELLAPALILTVGQTAARTMLGSDDTLEQLRGKVHQIAVGSRTVPLVATYHPDALLRDAAGKLKGWHDLCLARSVEPLQVESKPA